MKRLVAHEELSPLSLLTHDDLFPMSSETGSLMRQLDWSQTSLGLVEKWPQSLRTSVSICLNSAFAILIWWGSDLVMLYNDAYIPLISNKHPRALGSNGKDIFPEVWDTIGPMLAGVMQRGEAVRADDLLLFLNRKGYPEECYFTFSYSPILDESGGVGGIFTPVQETTERVIGERRLRTLARLADVSAEEAHSAEQVCQLAAAAMAENFVDLPFVAIYLFEEDGNIAKRCAYSGAITEKLAPERVKAGAHWPPVAALWAGEERTENNSFLPANEVPLGMWATPLQQFLAVPMTQSGSENPRGFILFGANPRKRLDEAYRTFLSLVAGHVINAINDAEAIEQERQRAKSLVELDRAKTAFFSNVSHEFRTPLTLIMGPLEDVVADNSIPPHTREKIELAQRNSVRLQKLVNNLLDFSRIEAGRAQAVFEPVDLAQLTEDLASSFRSTFEKAGLFLTVHAPRLSAPVHIDRDMWEKILLNLLSNAFKFTFAGGVTVELQEQDGTAQLTVTDTGTGIPQTKLPKIFQRFQRVEGSRGRSYEGTGIGLALVHELVRLHGGTISVESEEGKGTCFTVVIPTGSAHLAPEQIGSARQGSSTATRIGAFVTEALRWIDSGDQAGPSLQSNSREAVPPIKLNRSEARPRILVADDNADMRQYVTHLLHDHFEVETVANGELALASIRRQRPDIVLSDIMMPVMDGLALLAAVRAEPATASLPFILLSARAGEEEHIEGLQVGADDYLVKPFSARELIARIASALKISEIRATAERKLRESEQELRYTVELNPQVPWTADAKGRVLDLNTRWLELTGLTKEQTLGDGWLRIQHPEDLNRIIQAWSHAVSTGEPYDVEHRLRTASGEYRWMRARAYPRRDDSGRIVKWYGTTEDIHKHKLAEEAVRESERRMRVAQEAAGVLVWEWREGQGSVTWGTGAKHTYGRNADELTYDAWIASIHPEDRDHTIAKLQNAVKSLESYDVEFRVIWPDGSVHWLVGKGETFRDSFDGRATIIGANIDITTRKLAEAVLRESEARVREVLERTTDAVFVLDKHWRFTYLNPNAVSLIARGRDLLGKNLWEQFPEALDREFYRQYHKVMNERVPTQFEEYYPQPLDKWFEVHAYPTEQGIAVFFRDVTTRRKSEAALLQNEKLAAAGRLAASISHEINNPLESVTNLLYLLQGEKGLSADGEKFLQTAQAELARISHIANQTLRFYRQSSRPTVTDPKDVLDSVISLYDRRLKDAQVVIDRQYRAVTPITAFAGELRQVFANLVGNALDAIGSDGRIVLRQRPATEWSTGRKGVRISVGDTGHGMNPETMHRLFEPFYSTKGITGTGLGLWVSKGLVEKHSGTMKVRSNQNPECHGTVFSIFLPCCESKADQKTEATLQVLELGTECDTA
jgi:PAS domain S-box-containing protein